jgi:hypothetical protein
MDTWSQKIFEKCINYIETEQVQTALNGKVLNPILNHVLKRIFPYIVLICVMFVLLLLSVLITLGVIIFQTRQPYTVSSSLQDETTR